MDWFRMYSEFYSDPKVQSMSESMQRRLVMLLCLRCCNTLVTLQDDEIAFALRIDETELEQTKALFMRKGFIDSTWEIQNWDKRQFVSDSSAARVAKHRAAKKETDKQVDAPCNVTVTPQIQNRTDTEQIQNKEEKPSAKAPKFDFSGKLLELGADDKSIRDWLAVRKVKRAANTETVIESLIDEAAKAGISVASAVKTSAENNWQGFKADWLKPKAQAAPQKPSAHNGFEKKDYGKGVNDDGSF